MEAYDATLVDSNVRCVEVTVTAAVREAPSSGEMRNLLS